MRLADQGVGVYVIDNWSSDSAFDQIKQFLGDKVIGIERFPPEGPRQTFDLRNLLKRVEQVSSEIRADWFVHHNVDEEKDSPWPNTSLRYAFYHVDRQGFNAVDHTVLIFHPIDNSFEKGMTLGEHFKFFEFGTRPGHFTQIKAWKNFGQYVSHADSGGHEVVFKLRRVYPYKFILRHYLFRSQIHGERKLFSERTSRWNHHERAIGWHTHYDHIIAGHIFLRNSNNLIKFDTNDFYTSYLIERLSGIGIQTLYKEGFE